MKRLTAWIILLSLFLSGCGMVAERIKDPVIFYYVRSEYQSDMGEVIVAEEREASGHMGDISYLLALYLMGPADEQLESPIPPGARIFLTERSPDSVELKMTDTVQTLTDAEYTLACACLSLTCFDIAQVSKVTISSGERTVTMTREMLTLYDNSTHPETTEEPQ